MTKKKMDFDTLLYNGRVFDSDTDTVGIKKGRITFVGNYSNVAVLTSKRLIDLEGKTIVPGFIDSHTHMLTLGLSKVRVDLDGLSRDDALSKIVDYSKTTEEKVVVGYGWDESIWKEKSYLNKDDLDIIDKPVVLFRKDMHMASVNSKALSIVGCENSKDGIFKEEQLVLLAKLVEPSEDEMVRALNSSQALALKKGVVAVRDMQNIEAFMTLRKMNTSIKFYKVIFDRDYDTRVRFLDNEWGIKSFLDGSVGAGTVANLGFPNDNLKMDTNQFSSLARRFLSQGLPVAVHALGERATSVAISVFKEYNGKTRNSIEHCELVDEDLLVDIGDNIVISAQPNFLQWSHPRGLYEEKLGAHWLANNNLFRVFINMGKRLAFGSDCMPFGPNFGISEAIASEHPKQKISREEAIRAYTEGGAYLLGKEEVMGKIEIGYYADLAVFMEDYLTSGPEELKTAESLMTIVNGEIKFSTFGRQA
jgi:predicted amidohydrolase YtcJ